MPRYMVTLTARVIEVAQVEIEAADEETAEMNARMNAGSYDWERLSDLDDVTEVEIEKLERDPDDARDEQQDQWGV